MDSASPATAHFQAKRPGRFTRRVFNPLVSLPMRMGISVLGSRVLEVLGRSSGEPRRSRSTCSPWRGSAPDVQAQPVLVPNVTKLET